MYLGNYSLNCFPPIKTPYSFPPIKTPYSFPPIRMIHTSFHQMPKTSVHKSELPTHLSTIRMPQNISANLNFPNHYPQIITSYITIHQSLPKSISSVLKASYTFPPIRSLWTCSWFATWSRIAIASKTPSSPSRWSPSPAYTVTKVTASASSSSWRWRCRGCFQRRNDSSRTD